MHGRRSFFKRIATFVAVVALAPEIAFGSKLRLSDAPELDLQEMMSNMFSILRSRQPSNGYIDIYTDRLGVEAWKKAFPNDVSAISERPDRTLDKSQMSANAWGVYEQLRSVS